MFVKSLPQQFSMHFFLQPTDIFLVAPREKYHFVASLSPTPTIRRHVTGHIFLLPAASARPPPRLVSRFGTSFTRWARNYASLHTAHRTLPRRARKMGSREEKIGGFRPKTGAFRSKHPRFYPPARTHAAQARTKKRTAPQFICTVLYIL